jgi:hypothetical protein
LHHLPVCLRQPELHVPGKGLLARPALLPLQELS